MEIKEFQNLIYRIYFKKDSARGVGNTFQWFTEEVGELARAIRKKERKLMEEEFADCFAWLTSLASINGVDMEDAVLKYKDGCPKCGEMECECEEK